MVKRNVQLHHQIMILFVIQTIQEYVESIQVKRKVRFHSPIFNDVVCRGIYIQFEAFDSQEQLDALQE